VRLFLLLLTAASLLAQNPAVTANRIYRAYGAPSTGCNSSNDVGKVFYRIDAAAPGSSYYGCSNTASGTYTWETSVQAVLPGFVLSPPSTAQYNGYAVKYTAPFVDTSAYNVYSGMWIDYGGFPSTALLGATLNGVLSNNEVFRISQNVTQSGHSQGLTIYQLTSSNQGVPFYVQASANTDSPSAVLYGGDFHIAGCEGIKCTGSNYPDHSPGLIIGMESDVEVRNAATTGLGVYSVCVNCNPFTANSAAFVSDANKSVGIGDTGYRPWGTSFLSKAFGAVHGLWLDPKNLTTISDSQDIMLCSWVDAGVTRACSSIYTTSNSLTFIKSPGSKVYLTDSAGTALSTLHYQHMANVYATTPNNVVNTDMSELAINTGATGTVQNNLPATPVAGSFERICVTAAQLFNWNAGSNTIRVGASSGTVLSSNTVGSCAMLIAVSSSAWYATDLIGNWLLDSVIVANTLNRTMTGSSGGATVAGGAAATYYSLSGNAAPSTEGTRSIVMPLAGTITGLYLYMGTASVGTSGATVVTLRKNAGNTAITFSLTFDQAAGLYSDTSHQVSYAAGDRLSVELDNSTNNGATGGIVSVAMTYR
jgi:hypothetical protein